MDMESGLSAQAGLAGARQNERRMALRALGVLSEPLSALLGDLQLERVIQIAVAGAGAPSRCSCTRTITRAPNGFQREGVLRNEELLAQMAYIRGAGHHIGSPLCRFLLLFGLNGSRDGQTMACARLLERRGYLDWLLLMASNIV